MSTHKRSVPEIPAPAERQIIRARNLEHARQTLADLTALHREFLANRRPIVRKLNRALRTLDKP